MKPPAAKSALFSGGVDGEWSGRSSKGAVGMKRKTTVYTQPWCHRIKDGVVSSLVNLIVLVVIQIRLQLHTLEFVRVVRKTTHASPWCDILLVCKSVIWYEEPPMTEYQHRHH